MKSHLGYAARLRAKGFRLTPQRLVILQVLEEDKAHMTPTEVFLRAQALLPGMTEATVYRTLSFLAEQELALVAHVGSGQLVYEFADHHHHHLICRSCRHMCEIDHAVLKGLYDVLEKTTSYHIDTSHVTFFGLCPDCTKS